MVLALPQFVAALLLSVVQDNRFGQQMRWLCSKYIGVPSQQVQYIPVEVIVKKIKYPFHSRGSNKFYTTDLLNPCSVAFVYCTGRQSITEQPYFPPTLRDFLHDILLQCTTSYTCMCDLIISWKSSTGSNCQFQLITPQLYTTQSVFNCQGNSTRSF